MSIVNFGSLNIDYVYHVPHFCTEDECVRAKTLQMTVGGKGLNQSVVISRAGAKVYQAGLIGPNGNVLKAYLEENHVDTSLLQACQTLQGHAVVQINPAGEHSTFVYGGSNSQLTPEVVDRCLAPFSRGDFLLLQNEVTSIPYMIEAAYEKRMRIIFNASPVDQDIFRSNCNKAEWLVVNEIECMEIADCDETTAAFAKMQQMYPDAGILLTLGNDGAVCYRDGDVIVQKAYPVKLADTVGAGDAFVGYFIAALSKNHPLEECLDMAAKAGAITVSREGAASAFPTIEEVQNWKF